jgi:hypothetical protein
MTRPITRRAVLAAALSTAAFAASGAPARAQDDEVQALLSKAAARMASLTSFHFEMETIEGRATVLENLEVTRIVGDVLRPDSFQATITAKVAVVNVDVQVISTGGSVWVTNPLDGGWEQIASAGETGAAEVTALINPDQLFLRALELIDEPTIEGNERLGDTDTTVVTGTFDPARISELATPEAGSPEPGADDEAPGGEMGPMLATEPVYLTAWIDDEGLVHLIEEEGPLTMSESDDVIRAITFSAFDEPVEIVSPEP